MVNVFDALGKVANFFGEGLAYREFGPDWKKKAEVLRKLNEVKVEREQEEVLNQRALREFRGEDRELARISAATGLAGKGVSDLPDLVQGALSPKAVEELRQRDAQDRELAQFYKMLPYMAPKPTARRKITDPAEAEFYGVPVGSEQDESFLAAKAARANAIAGRSATQDRWENFPTSITGVDPTTGQQTTEIIPRGEAVGKKTLKAAPATAVESLSKFDQADEALRIIEQDMGQYQNTSLLNIPKKAMTGLELDRKKNALAVQLGRALGEVGVFTDQDRATYARLMGPGLILTELAPEATQEWFDETKDFLKRMRQKRREHFRRSYGYIPGEDVTQQEAPEASKVRKKFNPATGMVE